jgi:hypothetical protein
LIFLEWKSSPWRAAKTHESTRENSQCIRDNSTYIKSCRFIRRRWRWTLKENWRSYGYGEAVEKRHFGCQGWTGKFWIIFKLQKLFSPDLKKKNISISSQTTKSTPKKPSRVTLVRLNSSLKKSSQNFKVHQESRPQFQKHSTNSNQA